MEFETIFKRIFTTRTLVQAVHQVSPDALCFLFPDWIYVFSTCSKDTATPKKKVCKQRGGLQKQRIKNWLVVLKKRVLFSIFVHPCWDDCSSKSVTVFPAEGSSVHTELFRRRAGGIWGLEDRYIT